MNISRTTIVTFIIILAILMLGVWFISTLDDRQASRELASSEATRALGSQGTTTSFVDISGDTTSLDDFLGKVMIVSVWASWSPFSAGELQLIADTVETYPSEEVVAVAINRGENIYTAQAYLEQVSVSDRIALIVDTEDNYYKTIDGYTMPETVVYDRTGNIVAHVRGQLSYEILKTHIATALEEKD